MHSAPQEDYNKHDTDLDNTYLNTPFTEQDRLKFQSPHGRRSGQSTPRNTDPFTEQEVHKQIQWLKNGKACGSDAILNEFIKNSPSGNVYTPCKVLQLKGNGAKM